MTIYEFEGKSGRSLLVVGGPVLEGDAHLKKIDEPEELVVAASEQFELEAQHTRRMGDLAVAEYLRDQNQSG